jgi:hypothetical protein
MMGIPLPTYVYIESNHVMTTLFLLSLPMGSRLAPHLIPAGVHARSLGHHPRPIKDAKAYTSLESELKADALDHLKMLCSVGLPLLRRPDVMGPTSILV